LGEVITPDGISLNKTVRIKSQLGDVVRVLRRTDIHYKDFGEVYISWVNPGVVKAWKKQKIQTMNLFVPVGAVRFVLIDFSGESTVINMSEDDDLLLTVDSGIWYGFKCMSKKKSMIINIADAVHDPGAVLRKDHDFFSVIEFEGS